MGVAAQSEMGRNAAEQLQYSGFTRESAVAGDACITRARMADDDDDSVGSGVALLRFINCVQRHGGYSESS